MSAVVKRQEELNGRRREQSKPDQVQLGLDDLPDGDLTFLRVIGDFAEQEEDGDDASQWEIDVETFFLPRFHQ
jgi:hypothetical protein